MPFVQHLKDTYKKSKITLAVLACGLFLVGCNNTPSSSSSAPSSSPVSNSSFSSSSPISSSVISSSTSSSSSSSSVAPSENVTLSADKTVLALGESAKVTITGNKGDISLKVADDSLVEGAIVKNEDGSYSVGMSEEATYGGIMALNAVSSIDKKVKATLNLKFVASVSKEHHALLNKNFDRLSGKNFDGKDFTSADSFTFSNATDGNYLNLAITIGQDTYRYFSNYDTRFNEIHFASETPYTDIDHKSYNSLTVKLFNSYVEVSVASLNATLMTSIPLSEDNVTLLVSGYPVPNPTGDTKKNTAKVKDKITMTLSSSSNDKLTYSFVATTGADAVNLNNVLDEYQEPYANKKEIEVKEDAKGKDVVIKASVSNGTTTIDRYFSFTVENPDDKPTVTTIDSKMIGTWSHEDDTYGATLKVIITSASKIEMSDGTDDSDTVTFSATNIVLNSTTKVSFTLSGDDDGYVLSDGTEIVLEYDSTASALNVTIGDEDAVTFEKE